MRKEIRPRLRRAAASLLLGALALGIILSSTGRVGAQEGAAKLEPYVETLPKSVVKIKMVPIPGGTIKIGNENVTIKPFWIASTETPWEAYDVFTASGPPSPPYGQEISLDALSLPSKSYILPDLGWGHNTYPVINVSHLSVYMYCKWLSGATGKKYRLPTEAEWEWACRAGKTGPWKMDKATMEKQVWYARNSDRLTHPVGTKAPNAWGLYDMLGNPGEWALDMKGEPVVCGGTFLDMENGIIPNIRRRWQPRWQETDPQFPKSRWWLADGKFVGFRVVCEP
jgi:formylglycine-generating enzyme required for sulfatase activity